MAAEETGPGLVRRPNRNGKGFAKSSELVLAGPLFFFFASVIRNFKDENTNAVTVYPPLYVVKLEKVWHMGACLYFPS